ncbi:MAG: hypothetical protein IPO81_15780 [Kouleothrix sp.]|nr:hypothetical protein [Kouleothrix sp.]
MLRERTIQLEREERRQRRALIIFSIAVLILLGLCSAISWQLVVRPSGLIPAGRVSDYADNQPHRIAVPQLHTSSLIARRDETLSEDTIFIRRQADGSWIALLGIDTLSGCFLYWDQQAGMFQDINCLGSRYTPEGRYVDGLKSGERPQDMARLATEVRDDQVFVRDELARER